jgi:flagellin
MLELAQQASNGTYSDTQRRAISVEYRALAEEFGRLGDSTSFNGISLLRGNHSNGTRSLQIQAGGDGGANSTISIDNADTASLSGTFDVSRLASANWDGSTAPPTINVGDFSAFLNWSGAINGPGGFELLRTRFNNNLFTKTMTDSQGNSREVVFGLAMSYAGADSLSSVTLMAFVKNLTDDGYVSATANFPGYISGALSIDAATGRMNNASAINFDTDIGIATLDLSGLRFISGSGNSAIDFSGVESSARALDAITTIQNRLTDLRGAYGSYGAAESRLHFSLNVLAATRDNNLAAESRIRDVDVAAESANLVRLQILQQAGLAVLAQAQNQHQIALQLLQI